MLLLPVEAHLYRGIRLNMIAREYTMLEKLGVVRVVEGSEGGRG